MLSLTHRRGTGRAGGSPGIALAVRLLLFILLSLAAALFLATMRGLARSDAAAAPSDPSSPLDRRSDGPPTARRRRAPPPPVPRRARAHLCYSRVHAEIGAAVLTSPEYGFNYTKVNAGDGDEWDVMYGGYPHCASGHRHRGNQWGWDWEMKNGLNRAMNDAGWDSLKPHQVYHPCMGCKLSYCNKREMCRLIRDHVDRELCYVLPDDLEQLKANMDGTRAWVMKEDGTNVHIHTGSGVTYLTRPDQLPTTERMAQGMFMVQPWVEPFLGEGIYRRKAELRFYIAVTEVYPLRAYIHNDPFIVMAAKLYTDTADAIDDGCVHDTHSGNHKCDRYVSKEFQDALEPLLVQNRGILFDDYAGRAGLSEARRRQIIEGAHDLISIVVRAGHYAMEDHRVNRGIRASGAMCFSHMRVDMGIRSDGRPLIYEISEFPGLYGIGRGVEQGLWGKGATEELFRMIGLDVPPIPKEKRAEYESYHLGGWMPLIN